MNVKSLCLVMHNWRLNGKILSSLFISIKNRQLVQFISCALLVNFFTALDKRYKDSWKKKELTLIYSRIELSSIQNVQNQFSCDVRNFQFLQVEPLQHGYNTQNHVLYSNTLIWMAIATSLMLAIISIDTYICK